MNKDIANLFNPQTQQQNFDQIRIGIADESAASARMVRATIMTKG